MVIIWNLFEIAQRENILFELEDLGFIHDNIAEIKEYYHYIKYYCPAIYNLLCDHFGVDIANIVCQYIAHYLEP